MAKRNINEYKMAALAFANCARAGRDAISRTRQMLSTNRITESRSWHSLLDILIYQRLNATIQVHHKRAPKIMYSQNYSRACVAQSSNFLR